MQITITVSGHEQISRQLGRMQDALRGKDRALTVAIDEAGAQSTEANFDAEGRPRWPDRKHEDKISWPKLDKTGAMKDHALSSWQDSAAWRRSGHELSKSIRTTHYGIYHQLGTRNMPKRPFVRFLERETSALAARLRVIGWKILQGAYRGR